MTGPESQHEATVQSGHRTTVPALPQAGQIPQASLLSLLLPLRAFGTKEIPHARMEHCL